jgi:hypothetical protein
MNVIVVAALALLILVILAIIFIGRMGKTTQGVDQCKGTCVATSEDCTAMGTYNKVVSDPCYVSGTKDIDNTNSICCVGV